MHADIGLIEERITRELYERVLPLIERERVAVDATAGPTPHEQCPIAIGEAWGAPWATTWFTITGELPDRWVGGRVETIVDLGFRRDPPGFQCEALIVDDAGRPLHGLHPRRRHHRLDSSRPGPFTIRIEAASNPTFPQFTPSPLGSPATAGDAPQYRFAGACVVLVDPDAEAFAHDLDVLDGVMRSLPDDDHRRPRMRRVLERSLDHLARTAGRDCGPDIAGARALLAPLLATKASASAHRIVAIGHAHIDTAWLWPVREAARKCTRTFASAVELMDDYPEYRFGCSQAQQYAWIEQRHPELFERIRAKVRDGQWIPLGGMWVEADMNLPSGESLARQIVFGQRYFESRLGARCTEVWIPDVFGYPASMPQLYAAGGMRRFVTQKLSWNTTNTFPHHTFWWEGLDGTRVLTHFPPVDTYNAEITPAECVGSAARFREAGWSDWSLMPFGFGDGGGGPTREMLERARRLADVDGAPRITIGTPAEFFAHVEHEALLGAPIPVWHGELYFETHRGTLTSQLRTKLGNRRCERLLRELELWSAASGRHADVDELWQRLLTQQFHDIIPGSAIAWVHADAEHEHADLGEELERRLAALFDELVPAARHVANAAGVDRAEVIEIDGRAVRVVVPANSIVPVVDTSASDRVVTGPRSIANSRLAVRLDDDGHLMSIIDVARARELLPGGSSAAVLELAPDRPVRYDAWDLESWTPTLGEPLRDTDSLRVVADGPLLGRIEVRRSFGSSTAVITYVLRAGSPRLDIAIDIDWQHREHLLSMVFPLDVLADEASCDIQFGHVRRPMHASNSWDAAKFEVCAHRYVDVSEPEFGVAILNDGRYGHGLSSGSGRSCVRVSIARAASYPDPAADRGRHTVNLALLVHGAGLGEVVAEAERFNMPLRVVSGSATAAPRQLVAVDAAGVEFDAVKLADDASGDVIVRLHEALGGRRRITVRAARPVSVARRCNLLEEPYADFEVCDGVCALELRPFEIITLRLTLAA